MGVKGSTEHGPISQEVWAPGGTLCLGVSPGAVAYVLLWSFHPCETPALAPLLWGLTAVLVTLGQRGVGPPVLSVICVSPGTQFQSILFKGQLHIAGVGAWAYGKVWGR